MKTTFTLIILSLLFNFSRAQQKYPIVDETGRPANYGVNSLRSKIPIYVSTGKQTKSIVPFNEIPNDPLGSMVYLLNATTISATTQIKKDSLSYYRYSIFENDTTVVKANAQLSKVDFIWPPNSDFPGYLTMNFGISNVRNKKITIKIYRLPEEDKVTTVIIYNKPLNPAKFIEISLIRKGRTFKIPTKFTPIFRVINEVIPLKHGIQFNVDQKTRGIHLTIKKTDLDFVYQVMLKKKSRVKSETVFFSNNWTYTGADENPLNFIPASYFSEPGTYELVVIPVVGRPNDEIGIDFKPTTILFTVLKPPIIFNTREIITGFIILILLTATAFLLMRRNNKKKLINANRQAEIAKMELNNLHSRLNPHFVFNALSGIQNLMNQNEIQKANAYLSKFARLTRSILNGKQLIALKDEHQLLEDYLAMEALRFNFNYHIKLNIEINILEVMIPTMLLQPFLENATKHSMSVLGNKGNLTVEFKSVHRDLILSVKDNGNGFNVQKTHQGLGLSLSKERIDLLNQMSAECLISLEVQSGPNGTTVIIILNNWL